MSFRIFNDSVLNNVSATQSLQLPQIDITLIPPSVFAPLPRGKLVIHTDNNLYYSDGLVWNPLATGIGPAADAIWEHVVGVAPSGNYIRIDATNPNYDGTESLLFGQQAFDPSTGSRVMFDQPNSAFRAGITTGTQWDTANRGVGSVAMGVDNIAFPANSGALSGTTNSVTETAVNSVICGGSLNRIFVPADPVTEAFIGGGLNNRIQFGIRTVCGGGEDNIIAANYGTICGGFDNIMTTIGLTVGGNGGFIGGGIRNFAQHDFSATPGPCVICGGVDNFADRNLSVIVGGARNTATLGGVICGGTDNTTSFGGQSSGGFIGRGISCVANSLGSGVCAGRANAIASPGQFNFIGSGDANTFSGGTIRNSVICGGIGNTITTPVSTTLDNSVIPGGISNTCSGNVCFVAGNTASDAGEDNCFVWGDASGVTVGDGGVAASANQWVVKSQGGVTFWSDAGATTGVNLAPGATAWAVVCEREKKRNITEVDYSDTLQRVDDLNIYNFVYKSDPDDNKINYGPMADEWHNLFPSSKDQCRIDTLDLDGVTLAAVKGLIQFKKQAETQIEELTKMVQALQAKLN